MRKHLFCLIRETISFVSLPRLALLIVIFTATQLHVGTKASKIRSMDYKVFHRNTRTKPYYLQVSPSAKAANPTLSQHTVYVHWKNKRKSRYYTCERGAVKIAIQNTNERTRKKHCVELDEMACKALLIWIKSRQEFVGEVD